MASKSTSKDAQFSLVEFQAPCDELSSKEETGFKLLHSTKPQRVKLLGKLMCDEQVGFYSRGGEESWGDLTLDASKRFASAEANGYESVTVFFVPKAQESEALAAIERLVKRWPSGQDKTVGYFAAGVTLFGLARLPDGLMIACSESGVWAFGHEDGANFMDSQIKLIDLQELNAEEGGRPDYTRHAVFTHMEEVGGGEEGAKNFFDAFKDFWEEGEEGTASFMGFLRAQFELKALNGAVAKSADGVSGASESRARRAPRSL